jgi:hypothetical protein
MAEALISYPLTEEGLRSALEALGTTADAVARNLEAMGFRGCRSKESNCPVAHYALASIPDAREVSVIYGGVAALNAADDRVDVPMTDAIEHFVEFFDAGGYPGLEVPDASS